MEENNKSEIPEITQKSVFLGIFIVIGKQHIYIKILF